jgi:hypothetical protein
MIERVQLRIDSRKIEKRWLSRRIEVVQLISAREVNKRWRYS